MKRNILKIKRLILILFFLIVFIATSCFVSYITFDCANFSASVIGLGKIIFSNTNYVEIQKNPKVIIVKPNNSFNNLVNYMEGNGFTLVEQMGALIIFENSFSIKQSVFYHLNRYCSTWVWAHKYNANEKGETTQIGRRKNG